MGCLQSRPSTATPVKPTPGAAQSAAKPQPPAAPTEATPAKPTRREGSGPMAAPPPAAAAPPPVRAEYSVPKLPEKLKKPNPNSILGYEYESVTERFKLGKVLGRGQFGTTRVATDIRTNKVYACKSIPKSKLVTKEDREDVKREVQIMHHLNGHPNITFLVAAMEDRTTVHLVMDLCSGGELFDRISKEGHFTEATAASVIRTLLSVVAHCHSLGVVHRDLKPENFLMSTPGPDAQIKCADFGLSCFFKPGERLHDLVGSAFYVAPEVLKRDYGPECDIWSCGVILYILLSGMPPFWGNVEQEIFDSVAKGVVDFTSDPWPSISDEAKDCVRCMLVKDPKKRATVPELLRHPWMRENGVASTRPLNDAIITRLGTFVANNKLKREAMRIIAAGLPEEEIAGLQSIFEAIDRDHSGTITAEELHVALREKGAELRKEDLEKLVSLIDSDANGTIDYHEFLAATLSQHQLLKEEHIVRAFKHFDTDNSGQISADELKAGLMKDAEVTPDMEREITRIIEEVDKDKNGQIDYDEFCDMMHKNRRSALKVVSRRRPNHSSQ